MSFPFEEDGLPAEDDIDADVPALDGMSADLSQTGSHVLKEDEADDADGNNDESSGAKNTSQHSESDVNSIAQPPPEDEFKEDHEDSDKNRLQNDFAHVAQPSSTSPAASLASIPDDTPSIRSFLSSPASHVQPSRAMRPDLGSPTPSFRPFDRRFSSRLTLSSTSSRPTSPAFLKAHSRATSLASQIVLNNDDTDDSSPPWEIVRWTKLKKLNTQCYSEAGKRNFGFPTCMTVSHNIVLGTSKGIILIFDVNQNLKAIIGQGTKAIESGAITSIAVSADYTTVAAGHSNGNIFTWDSARPAKPFLQIPALSEAQAYNRTTDGHMPGTAVTHLGFLGTRHTALVSADDRGMAFSHLASRGTGILGRSVKTTRVLGRYPEDKPSIDKPRKASTVLAFAPLPLGNVERAMDSLGLTAMLTPYLLVIVSTTPVAETQHKASRPKQIAAHGATSGCLAWFPAVKLKVPDPATGDITSRVKLVYCWSNILTVLEIQEVESTDKEKPPNLIFKAEGRWTAEEAIVAVQWLSRSVLCILTITQRLIILEDRTMRVTEAFDLIGKHIFHKDLFSEQLHALVEQLDESDPSMHGVVADAFYMSFKAYKGKMFMLGFNDVSVGTVSNWADRLIAMMENGDYIGAIALASSYYVGEGNKLTIGLPEDESLRHSMVRDKIVEIMTASLRYAFGENRIRGREDLHHLRDLVEACFAAALRINDQDYVFEEVYEWFESGNEVGFFLETLEPYILSGEINLIPPVVVKSLVNYYVDAGRHGRLEEMICQMNTATLDLDELTTLCKRHNLYDALIYVWNGALEDYITPLIDLLNLLKPAPPNEDDSSIEDPIKSVTALKMFPYLSYVFTGRQYPSGDALDDRNSFRAKSQLYWFLFSGKNVIWPTGSQKEVKTMESGITEPSFPYLRMILNFDAPSFLSALNEAFEDAFLNDSPEQNMQDSSESDLPEEELFGSSINRQYIVSILLEVMSQSDYGPEDSIYLDMFIARNLPKFPQYLLLSGSALHNILMELCDFPGPDLADDAQLSVEYLLSIYHPSDLGTLIPLFRNAGFYRVLKSIYRTEKRYSELIETYFEDPNDHEDVYDCISDCLGVQTKLAEKQITEIHEVLRQHALQLIDLDTARTATTINTFAFSLNQQFLSVLEDAPYQQYEYLDAIMSGDVPDSARAKNKAFLERFIQLMCKYEPSRVVGLLESLQVSDLRLDEVLPFMEDSGVIDAAVILMARDGQVRNAMDRLIRHLESVESALLSLLRAENESTEDTNGAVEDVAASLQKYTSVGIWLCTGQGRRLRRSSAIDRRVTSDKEALLPDELLWLDLVDMIVQISTNISAALTESDTKDNHDLTNGHVDKYPSSQSLAVTLRSLVQQTFTALLNITSIPKQPEHQISFLRILRALLARAALSSPNLSELRAVISSIFSAYTYERNILLLANRLIDKDLFVSIKEASERRQQGWRPKGSVCEACKRRVWGHGLGSAVYHDWEEREERMAKSKERKRLASTDHLNDYTDRGKAFDITYDEESAAGKGKSIAKNDIDDLDNQNTASVPGGMDSEESEAIVVLACRHIYHRACLEQMNTPHDHGDDREFRCPIDG